jgi:glucose-1-phosphate thymidylyltransferase
MELRAVMVVEDAPGRQGDVGGAYALGNVANRPIAHHVIDTLRSSCVDEVILVTSEALARPVSESVSEPLRQAAIPMRHVVQVGDCDMPGALRSAAPIVAGARCIVHSAAGLLGDSLGPFVVPTREQPDATVFVHQGHADAGHLSRATQRMLHLAELDPEHAPLSLAGVWILGPKAIDLIAESPWRTAGDADLTGVAERITGNAGRFEAQFVDAWCSYSGDSSELLELNRIALDRLQTQVRRRCTHGNRVEGRVMIHERASVRSSVIVGPTVIGADATIADAYIGPYTSVGARARIEGAEIERSIVYSDASILHVGGRIVSSVVGRNARVFRDFSLPRALRLHVGDGAEVALC